MEIKLLKTKKDYINWMEKVEEFLLTQDFVIPQNMLYWESIFNGLNKYKFETLIAIEDNMILDLISYVIYEGKFGNVMISLPLIGYGGFISTNKEIWNALIKELEGIASLNKCTTLTMSTPVYRESLQDTYMEVFNPDYVYNNFYQYSTFNGLNPLFMLEKKKRDKIKNSINKGAKITEIKILTRLEDWEEWIGIYNSRYKEIGAVAYPTEFFIKVFQKACETQFKYIKLYGLFENDMLVGGILVTCSFKNADYFSSAFLTSKNYLNGTTITLNYIFNDLAERGFLKFNWQSSPGRLGVYNYKKSWGANEGEHLYLVKVIGNPQNLLSIPLEMIKEEYKGMFILPYKLWGEKSGEV